jgi:NTE family protein
MMANSIVQRRLALGLAMTSLLLQPACAGSRAVNAPLAEYAPGHGYVYTDKSLFRDPGKVIIYLAFSGGGTRAAAFAYGALQELEATEVVTDGVRKSLLDEVDTISGVSGGSFPAAYYGLFGTRIFEDFESRFLKKNIQGALTLRVLRPWNLVRLFTPWLSRSDLASQYYDEKIFERATFADLREAHGPRININATDLSSGRRVTFRQDTFNAMCIDLDQLPVATAVASSSAVPVLLSPITFRNYAGSCGFEPPAWVAEVLEEDRLDPRRQDLVDNFLSFSNPDSKKYLHLLDGATSDNLGLRATIDFMAAVQTPEQALEIHDLEMPDHLVVIVVNAETDPDPSIDLTSAAPSFAALMTTVSGGQIRRYNFETERLVASMIDQWSKDLSTPDHPVQAHMISLRFDQVEDESERKFFNRLPTNFGLGDGDVDRLTALGRQLLRDSGEFQGLLRSLR